MPWRVYILLCDQKTYYVGLTNNLDRRISEHKSKYNLSTKKFSDIQLVFFEQFKLRSLAERREKQIKGWSVAKKQALISGDLDKLIQLGKPR